MFKIVKKSLIDELVTYKNNVSKEIADLKELLLLVSPKSEVESVSDYYAIGEAIRIIEKEHDLRHQYLNIYMSKSFKMPHEILKCAYDHFEKTEIEIRGPFREELVSEHINIKTRDKAKVQQFINKLDQFNYKLIKKNDKCIIIDF